MQSAFETMNNEPAVQTAGDQARRWYATRVWHCSDGELTCERVYVPCESRGRAEHLQ